MRNFSAAGERWSELSSGAGLAGASFGMEWSTSRLGVGGKSTTDYGKNSGGVVVKVGVFLWAESSFQRRASSAVAA